MKLMIVEDDKALAKGIELALSEKENEITVCYDLKTAEEMWESENADLVILDVNLPDGSGYDFLAFVKESSKVPVILLTANDLEIDQVTGLSLGADDYITKPFNILEVKARMKAILRRNAVTEKKVAKSNVINAGDMKIDCDSRNLYIAGRPINLTAKEFDLLELLAVNPGKVYSRDNLLKAVWGQDYSGDGRTVDVHMRRLREKIEDNPSEPKYVHTKWGVGYYFNV